nr:hypothetical protein Iba_chr15dCG6810 [Ipomoea batatas]
MSNDGELYVDDGGRWVVACDLESRAGVGGRRWFMVAMKSTAVVEATSGFRFFIDGDATKGEDGGGWRLAVLCQRWHCEEDNRRRRDLESWAVGGVADQRYGEARWRGREGGGEFRFPAASRRGEMADAGWIAVGVTVLSPPSVGCCWIPSLLLPGWFSGDSLDEEQR